MGKRILAIDDEPLILKSIKKALDKIGFEVEIAGNKEDFQRAVNNGSFDLVILDLHMDDLTKDEIIRECKERNTDTRFLIISGSDLPENGHYIQKPFRISELRDKVRELLNEPTSGN